MLRIAVLAAELGAQLPDGAEPLGEHLVVMDRLEVQLAREHEVAVRELVVTIEDGLERDAD